MIGRRLVHGRPLPSRHRSGKRRNDSAACQSAVARGGRGAAGRTIWNLVPRGPVSNLRTPPWDSTIEREMDSPRPRPFGFVVAKGRNGVSAISGGSPGPVSATEILDTLVRPDARNAQLGDCDPTLRHGLDRIAHQVHDDLLELRSVSEDLGEVGCQIPEDATFPTPLKAHRAELNGLAQSGVDIHRLPSRSFLAKEAMKAIYDRRGPSKRFKTTAQPLQEVLFPVAPAGAGHQVAAVDEAGRRGQGLRELMGHGRRCLPDSAHARCVPELRLQLAGALVRGPQRVTLGFQGCLGLSLQGHVCQRREDFARVSVRAAPEHGADEDGEFLAFPGHLPLLADPLAMAFQRSQDFVEGHGTDCSQQVVGQLSDCVLGRPAVKARTAFGPEADSSVEVGGEERAEVEVASSSRSRASSDRFIYRSQQVAIGSETVACVAMISCVRS